MPDEEPPHLHGNGNNKRFDNLIESRLLRVSARAAAIIGPVLLSGIIYFANEAVKELKTQSAYALQIAIDARQVNAVQDRVLANHAEKLIAHGQTMQSYTSRLRAVEIRLGDARNFPP